MPWEAKRQQESFDDLARGPRGNGSAGLLGHEQEFLDSLHVMEEGMRRFYVRAMAAKQTKQPDKMIDAAMIQAVQIADARLSAVKLG
jgi:hypothetical protein